MKHLNPKCHQHSTSESLKINHLQPHPIQIGQTQSSSGSTTNHTATRSQYKHYSSDSYHPRYNIKNRAIPRFAPRPILDPELSISEMMRSNPSSTLTQSYYDKFTQ